MTEIKKMTIGQVLDYCIEYNNRHQQAEQQGTHGRASKRKATQADINAWLG